MIGMNEVGLNAKWLRKDLTHVETQDFAKEVLNHMRDRLVMYQEEYGDLYNLEATPAESTTYRLAKHDKEQYPDIITAGEPVIHRTTQTAPIFRLAIRRTFSMHWIFRTDFRLFIPPERYSMHS